MVENTDHRVVVDASAILSFIFPDEQTPKNVTLVIRKATKNKVILLAPTLLSYEIGNAIKSAVKQKRINELTATAIVEVFNQIKIIYFDPNIVGTIEISLKHNLSFYDASYLCLAEEQKSKLLTLDTKLQESYNNKSK